MLSKFSVKILEVGQTVVVGVFYANMWCAFSNENQELDKIKKPENGLDKPFWANKKPTYKGRFVVEVTGLEPAASWSQTRHSTKLSYTSLLVII